MGYCCPRCLNTNKKYFFCLRGKVYCRKCLCCFGKNVDKKYIVNPGNYKLDYELTDKQKEASNFSLSSIMNKKDCAINAVCGAGKTEIIYETLKYCLNNNLKIGVAIPRKDVVIELKERIAKAFNICVIAVYGGNHENLEGDIIIFTTHQAFRYIDYFDVLIIDEVDAFPYKDNDVLKRIVHRCSKNFIYLSATMPKYIEKDYRIEKFYLNRRYHGYDLPVPKCVTSINMVYTLKRYLKMYKDKVVLVYFPTISLQKRIANKVKSDYVINSKTKNRETILQEIKRLDKGIVFTTTILERGITIKDVQVVVYGADHKLFDKDSLIQISGRVGRNKNYHKGNIIFICKIKNKSIKSAINTLKKCNE